MKTHFNTLIDFIKNTPNWQEVISLPPYYIKVKQCPFAKEDGSLKYPELYMLSYNQLESNFDEEIVRCCRGSIVSIEDANSPKMICTPFYKFFNYQEKPDEIDWSTAKVLEKVDGSLLKLFNYKNEWIWVTNNGWDINNEIPVALSSSFMEPETDGMTTFGQLKDYAIEKTLIQKGVDFNKILLTLDMKCTYMFELISPKNRVICDYAKTELVLLGCRNRETYNEYADYEVAITPLPYLFRQPKKFDLKNIDEVLDLCNSYKDAFNEGVVVCDANFNRFKIKCKHYLALKGLKGEIGFTDQKVFEAIKAEAIDDAIGAFPEIIPQAERIKTTYLAYRNKIKDLCDLGLKEFIKAKYEYICSEDGYSDESYEVTEKEQKKKYAAWVFKNYPEYSGFLFECVKECPNRVSAMIDRIEYQEIEKVMSNVTGS